MAIAVLSLVSFMLFVDTLLSYGVRLVISTRW